MLQRFGALLDKEPTVLIVAIHLHMLGCEQQCGGGICWIVNSSARWDMCIMLSIEVDVGNCGRRQNINELEIIFWFVVQPNSAQKLGL